MLTSSVSGDIFASPSASQILTAIELALATAGSNAVGVLLLINNYTGDRLNFGLALSRARAFFPKLEIDSLVVADDVSLLRTDSLIGPRGLAGNILVCKVLGAFTAAGYSLSKVKSLGEALVSSLASVGVGLEHCHIPGRSTTQSSQGNDAGLCEIGMGLHNEPGVRKSTMSSAQDLVGEMLDMILQSREGGFVQAGEHLENSDEVVLFVNNLGGISQLELSAVVDETLIQLQSVNINPRRVYASAFMTSLNAPGFSISLINISEVRRSTGGVDVYSLLDSPTDALAWIGVRVGWPSPLNNIQNKAEQTEMKLMRLRESYAESRSTEKSSGKAALYWREVDVSTSQIEAAMREACNAVFSIQDDLTEFDTIVGDGDCGETFSAGAKAILQALDSGELDISALSPFHLMQTLANICEQSMGGTIGALFAIFFASSSAAVPKGADDTEAWYKVPERALDELSAYTPAHPGDRTLVDALRPFSKELAQSHDFSKAVKEARKGAESTINMQARLGRATYVGQNAGGEKGLPPDPGAWGVAAIIEGFYKGWRSER